MAPLAGIERAACRKNGQTSGLPRWDIEKRSDKKARSRPYIIERQRPLKQTMHEVESKFFYPDNRNYFSIVL
ncbi:MAG: hypothetical protein JWM99_2734 [Verrucomicrobiales bacterium]|nr:hypothetical protein [Verrucomicrobiales bacterium]